MSKRFLNSVLLCLLPIVWATGAHCTQKLVDRVAIIVNGIPILQSEIQAVMHQSNERSHEPSGEPSHNEHLSEAAAKNVLIEETLYLSECKSLFQHSDEAEAEEHKRKIMQQNGMNERTFQAALKAQGLTEKSYMDRVKRQICKGKLFGLKVKNRVNVSKADILEAYKKRYGSAAEDAKLDLIQVLLRFGKNKGADSVAADKAFMLSLKSNLETKNRGQSFIDSVKIATKTQKRVFVTELENVGRGDLAFPELERVVFGAQEGEIVGPIQTKAGWHLMYVKKRELNAKASLEKVEKALHEELWTERYDQALQAYTSGLRAGASIIELGIEEDR
jgi:parvulin-like peptidyl-prolyl isomerase